MTFTYDPNPGTFGEEFTDTDGQRKRYVAAFPTITPRNNQQQGGMVTRGMYNVASDMLNTGGLLADFFGSEDFTNSLYTAAGRFQDKAMAIPRRVGKVEEIENFKDTMIFVGETLAENLPMLATVFLPGAAAGIGAKLLGAGASAQRMAGTTAAFLSNVGLLTGESVDIARANGVDPKDIRVVGSGLAKASADFLPLGYIYGRMTGRIAPLFSSIFQREFTKQAVKGGFLKMTGDYLGRAGQDVLTLIAAEIPTEMTQEYINIALDRSFKEIEGMSNLNEAEVSQLKNAAAGAAAFGFFGVATAIRRGGPQERESNLLDEAVKRETGELPRLEAPPIYGQPPPPPDGGDGGGPRQIPLLEYMPEGEIPAFPFDVEKRNRAELENAQAGGPPPSAALQADTQTLQADIAPENQPQQLPREEAAAPLVNPLAKTKADVEPLIQVQDKETKEWKDTADVEPMAVEAAGLAQEVNPTAQAIVEVDAARKGSKFAKLPEGEQVQTVVPQGVEKLQNEIDALYAKETSYRKDGELKKNIQKAITAREARIKELYRRAGLKETTPSDTTVESPKTFEEAQAVAQQSEAKDMEQVYQNLSPRESVLLEKLLEKEAFEGLNPQEYSSMERLLAKQQGEAAASRESVPLGEDAKLSEVAVGDSVRVDRTASRERAESGFDPRSEEHLNWVERIIGALHSRMGIQPSGIFIANSKTFDDAKFNAISREQFTNSMAMYDRLNNVVAYNADNLKTRGDVVEAFLHEIAGHFGLKVMLSPKQWDNLVDSVWKTRREAMINHFKETHPNYIAREKIQDFEQYKDTIIEEYLAHIAQTNPQASWFRRVILKIKVWINTNFSEFNVKLTDADAIALMADVRKFLEQPNVTTRNIIEHVIREIFAQQTAEQNAEAGAMVIGKITAEGFQNHAVKRGYHNVYFNENTQTGVFAGYTEHGQMQYAVIRGYATIREGKGIPLISSLNNRTLSNIGIADPVSQREIMTAYNKFQRDMEASARTNPLINPRLYNKSNVLTRFDTPYPQVEKLTSMWKDMLLGKDFPLILMSKEWADKNYTFFVGGYETYSIALRTDYNGQAIVLGDPSGKMSFDKSYPPMLNIAFNKVSNITLPELIAHELGHFHMFYFWEKMPLYTKMLIENEHIKYLREADPTTNSYRELQEKTRPGISAQFFQMNNRSAVSTTSQKHLQYMMSFSEWYADRVARAITSSDAGINDIEKHFKELGLVYKAFYNTANNQAKFGAGKTFESYLSAVFQRWGVSRAMQDPTNRIVSMEKLWGPDYRRHTAQIITSSPVLNTYNGRDGDMYFDGKVLNEAIQESDKFKSRSLLVYLSPRDFLNMAKDGQQMVKHKRVAELFDNNTPFNEIPFLLVEYDGQGGTEIVGHEGRHRMRILEEHGIKNVPVILRSVGVNPIRWNEQNNQNSMDRYDQWPEILQTEDGNIIPFVWKREEIPALQAQYREFTIPETVLNRIFQKVGEGFYVNPHYIAWGQVSPTDYSDTIKPPGSRWIVHNTLPGEVTYTLDPVDFRPEQKLPTVRQDIGRVYERLDIQGNYPATIPQEGKMHIREVEKKRATNAYVGQFFQVLNADGNLLQTFPTLKEAVQFAETIVDGKFNHPVILTKQDIEKMAIPPKRYTKPTLHVVSMERTLGGEQAAYSPQADVDRLSSIWGTKFLSGVLTPLQMVEQYGIEPAAKYLEQVQGWWARKRTLTHIPTEIATEIDKLGKKDYDVFNELVYEISERSDEAQRRLTDTEVQDIIRNISAKNRVPVGKHIYELWEQMDRSFRDVLSELENGLEKQTIRNAYGRREISESKVERMHKLWKEAQTQGRTGMKALYDLMDKDLRGLEAISRLSEIQNDMKQMRDRNYFPRMRFGRWAATWKDESGKVIHFSTFTSYKEREQAIKNIDAAYRGQYQVQRAQVSDKEFSFLAMPPAMYDLIQQQLSAVQNNEGTMGLTAGQKEKLREIFYLRSPGRAFLKHLVKRKNTAGYAREALRTYATYMQNSANHIARVEYHQKMQNELANLMDLKKETLNADKLSIIQDYFINHYEYIMNPGNDLAKYRALGFLWYLGFNVKSAMVNLTQVPMVAYPYLAARYGDSKSVAAISKAYKTITRYKTGGMLDPDLDKALRRAIEEGFVDESQATTLAGYSEDSTLQMLTTTSRFDSMVSKTSYYGAFLFQHAEKYNREVVFTAARDLALESGASAEAAYIAGRNAVQTSMFEYAKWNRAPFMRGKKSIFFLFWQFMQSLSFIAGGGVGKGTALRVWGMLLLAAGFQGLPFMENILDILDFGSTKAKEVLGMDDPKTDLRNDLRELTAELGMNPDLAMHGLSRFYGLGPLHLLQMLGAEVPMVDISGSMSAGRVIPGMEDMLGGQRDQSAQFGRAIADIMGPVLGMPFALWKAMESDDPDTWKTWERALPVAIQSASKAVRRGIREEETFRGGGAIAKFDPNNMEHRVELIAQAFSFAPTRMNQKYALRNSQENMRQYWITRRSLALENYAYAVMSQDKDAQDAALAAVARFNRAVPVAGARIDNQTIVKSIKQRYGRASLREQGIPPEDFFIKEFLNRRPLYETVEPSE